MNMEDFRKALSSDATVENEKLKKEIEKLKKQNKKLTEDLEEQKEIASGLEKDCYALSNRCYVSSSGMGIMCIHCVLSQYHCTHMPTDEELIKYVKELRGK